MKCRLYLLLFFISSLCQLSAQVYEVKGEIYSEWGSSLPGAVIRIQNRMVGTLSNWDGTFHIKDTVPIEVLEIYYLGFHPKEVVVKDSSFLLIELEEDEYYDYPDAYDYFPRKPVSEGYPSYHLLPPTPYTTPLEPMQGRIAGVKMNRFSGAPSASLSLRIRGHNHIASSNEPLYVINGMEMEGTPSGLLGAIQMAPGFSDPLRYVLPAHIKTLRILKGPETARYGQRGANGVVIIETKGIPHTSKKWIYKQSLSMEEIPNWSPLMDAEAYNSWAEDRQLISSTLLQGQKQNWQQKISRKAFATSHQLLRRGDLFFNPYRLMLSLQGRQGPIANTSLQRLNLNFSTKLGDRIKALKIHYQGAVDLANQLPAAAHGMPSLDLLQSTFSMNPTLRDTSMPFAFIQNPLSIQQEVLFKSRGSHHLLSLHPMLDGDEWGKLEAVLATEIKGERSQINSPFPLSSDPTVPGNLSQNFQQRKYWASVTYTNNFYSGDHDLDIEVD
jgi:iron complex outermembrane receptor protein